MVAKRCVSAESAEVFLQEHREKRETVPWRALEMTTFPLDIWQMFHFVTADGGNGAASWHAILGKY